MRFSLYGDHTAEEKPFPCLGTSLFMTSSTCDITRNAHRVIYRGLQVIYEEAVDILLKFVHPTVFMVLKFSVDEHS